MFASLGCVCSGVPGSASKFVAKLPLERAHGHHGHSEPSTRCMYGL
jgi:hypothetical protein